MYDAVPVIELQIRSMGEQVRHSFMTRREEMDDMINTGIERALRSAPETIIASAMEEANKAIQQEITNYFSYGPGRDAIKAVLNTALEPLRSALSKKAPK